MLAQRFRTIEQAANEDVSFGWVTADDPTGETFDAADMDYDCGIWLRMRVDKKTLPPKWVAIYRCVAEKARGRPLTRRERSELKTDMLEKLLPRVLPSVNLVDVLFEPRSRRILMFSASRTVREQFEKLFHQTFEAHLLPADPVNLARHLELSREQEDYLAQVSPVRWPRDRQDNTAVMESPQALESSGE